MKTAIHCAVATCAVVGAIALGARGEEASCVTVPAGVATTSPGAFNNVGQCAIGDASNGSVTMHAGVMYCLLDALPHPLGDCSGDFLITLDDLPKFVDCVGDGGPDTSYVSVDDTCVCMDFDGDNDVDLRDFQELQSLMN